MALNILSLYAAIGFSILFLTAASRSHRAMNALAIFHPLAYLALTIYSLQNIALPSFYPLSSYFFMDYLGAYEILMAALLFFLAAAYSKGYVEGSIEMGELNRENLRLFYMAFNLLLIVLTYSFLSNNLALFWILAELTTAFSAVLIVTLNAKKNIGAALKYIFITSTSMLFSFIGLIFLFAMTENALDEGTLNWSVLMAHAAQFPPSILLASFVFTFAGFAAKSGVVPFHAWLPTAHSKAPAPISVILSGSITSVGIYGILRMYAIAQQTSIASKASMLLMAFGIGTVAIAALSMLSQSNLKKLIGYSTIENIGLMLFGIGIGTPLAIFWVLFHKLAHSLTKAVLFFSAGIIHHQYESVRIENIKNALKLQPLASWALIIGTLSIIGMPPFAVFISKLFILLQTESVSLTVLFILLLLLLAASGAFGIFLARIMSQVSDDASGDVSKNKIFRVSSAMKLSIILSVFFVLALGVFFPESLRILLDKIVLELGFSG